VQTTSGAVRGVTRGGGAAFLSVPFAAPPIGDRRFLAPQPRARWDGIRPCTTYGPTPQRRPFAAITAVPDPSIPGEDTLSVSVFTPAPSDRDAGLPVLAWVHGGAYFAGSPASPWYDGRAFARDGVVTVVVSYRLGFDGYGWIDGAPLNRGVLDQIAALEWIQDNIRGFCGDPARVTVAGQSAGGGSVLTLLTSPRTTGLLHGAISQSGAASALDTTEAEGFGREFANALGVAPTLDGFRSVSEDRILDLEREHNHVPTAVQMSAPPARIIEAMRRDPVWSMDLAFAPVADGMTVTRVDDGIRAGRGTEVPLLLGANESDVVAGDRGDAEVDEVLDALGAAGATPATLHRFRESLAGPAGSQSAKGHLLSSYTFRAQALHFATARVHAGAGDRTWLYDFVHRSTATGAAGHCDELPFTWDLLAADGVQQELGNDPPQELATRMHNDWVQFIRSGTAPWQPASITGVGARLYGAPTEYDPDAYRLEAELTLNIGMNNPPAAPPIPRLRGQLRNVSTDTAAGSSLGSRNE
jgi:para-nitrobenzyl esterase